MKKDNGILYESLRYICLTVAVTFGLVTIIATGGSGNGGGSGSISNPAEQNLITSSTAPQIASSLEKITTGVERALFAMTLDVGGGSYASKTLLKHVNNLIQHEGESSSRREVSVRLLGTLSETEDCPEGGSVTTMISWDGSFLPTDCGDIIDPAIDFIFENCQEAAETINGTTGISYAGDLCLESPPAFSLHFTDFVYQNQDEDSDFLLDLTMDFNDIQYDNFDHMLEMYVEMNGSIYGTFDGDSLDLTYNGWSMTFNDLIYGVSNEITGLFLHFNGSFSGSIAGDSFNEAYEDLVLTFQSTAADSISGILLTIDGSYNGGCLDDWITIETLETIFIPDSSDSPTAGQIRLSGSGEATILFESDGSINIYVDGEQLSYADYEDLPSCI
jgi:hypothetical protein